MFSWYDTTNYNFLNDIYSENFRKFPVYKKKIKQSHCSFRLKLKMHIFATNLGGKTKNIIIYIY